MSEQSEILRRELKQLQLEAEKILDEIDAKEAEILQIEEDEANGVLFDLIVKRGKILQELISRCSQIKEIYVDDSDQNICSLRDTRSRMKLAMITYHDHNLEEFEEWVKLQIESLPFYQLLLASFSEDLIGTDGYYPLRIRLNSHNLLAFQYRPTTCAVTITHQKFVDYNEVEELLSNAYKDRKFEKSRIVDSDEIIFTSTTETVCNLVNLVETIEKLRRSVNQEFE